MSSLIFLMVILKLQMLL